MKKIITIFLFVTFMFSSLVFTSDQADAYVSVKGYYRSNGTYVAPHVRSNPNGLKYDNYSYTPSQGMYNETYGTKGSYWDTPTYVTDPDYYTGRSIYDSGQYNYPSSYYSSSVVSPSSVVGGYFIGSSLFCNSGYVKRNNNCQKAPNNSISYGGENFYCNTGYVLDGSKTSCVYKKSDEYCRSNFGNLAEYIISKEGCYCSTGSYFNKNNNKCEQSVVVDSCKKQYGENSYTNSGYCYCKTGFVWNGGQTSCVEEKVKKTLSIKTYIKNMVDYSPNLTCKSFGYVNPEDIQVCNLYKNNKFNYNWNVFLPN